MKTVCIIGAGQLGSRHLQGVHKSSHPLDIWVVDPSTESLKIAEERYNQVISDNEKSIHYVTSLDEVPYDIDITIIATSSKPRYKIVRDLLLNHETKSLILEKFLFPTLNEYDLVASLIEERNIKVYVNCPRRMYESYKYVESILGKDYPIVMRVEGESWGLCCNAIHFIDIFMKLCGEMEYQIDVENLIPSVKESKRKGYIEFNGEIKITTNRGDRLFLNSSDTGIPKDLETRIINNNNRIFINEVTGNVKINDKELIFTPPYQSDLTGKCVDSLYNGQPLSLTEYEESKIYHKIFLSKMLSFYNKLTNENTTTLPIT